MAWVYWILAGGLAFIMLYFFIVLLIAKLMAGTGLWLYDDKYTKEKSCQFGLK